MISFSSPAAAIANLLGRARGSMSPSSGAAPLRRGAGSTSTPDPASSDAGPFKDALFAAVDDAPAEPAAIEGEDAETPAQTGVTIFQHALFTANEKALPDERVSDESAPNDQQPASSAPDTSVAIDDVADPSGIVVGIATTPMAAPHLPILPTIDLSSLLVSLAVEPDVHAEGTITCAPEAEGQPDPVQPLVDPFAADSIEHADTMNGAEVETPRNNIDTGAQAYAAMRRPASSSPALTVVLPDSRAMRPSSSEPPPPVVPHEKPAPTFAHGVSVTSPMLSTSSRSALLGSMGAGSAELTAADPAAAPTLAMQIVESIRLQWSDRGGTARIQLDPSHLGAVTISLDVDASGQVAARLEAANPAVREWLHSNQQWLKSALADQQLTLDRLDVAEPPESRDADRRERHQPSPRERGSSRRSARPGTGDVFEVVA